MRTWARRECLSAAADYTSQLRGASVSVDLEAVATTRLYLAGHQPSLYHPGVWVKNFAIDALAKADGGMALNLIVDNDTLTSTDLRIPVGDRETLRVERIPFDTRRSAQPWEEARIQDRELFVTFADRVASTIAPSVRPMLLSQIWPDAVNFQQTSPRLADCLSAARHRQERRWGLKNLELPLSRLCETDSFLWFASHLLAQLPRFAETHNSILRAYRSLNRVRSRNHPVPELHEQNGWVEAPFWVWRAGDAVRRPVYARQQGRTLTLSDGGNEFAELRLTPEMDACCAVEALRTLPSQGIRLRTRALTTTLFSRLCLGDLFVHGIGGAKYDEMTDEIVRRFFGISAPAFLTMSATLYLPIADAYPVTPQEERRLRHQLRDLEFNAERHPLDRDARALEEDKRALIAAQHAAHREGLTRSQRRSFMPDNRLRYQKLKAINQQLASLAEGERARLSSLLGQNRQQLQVNRILEDREFSYCLYPAELLRQFFGSVLKLR